MSSSDRAAPAALLHAIGWNERLQALFVSLAAPGDLAGRVTRVDRGAASLLTARGELRAEPSPLLLRAAEVDSSALPACGDWAVLRPRPGTSHAIEALLPRSSVFARRAPVEAGRRTTRPAPLGQQVLAANVDVAFVVAAATDPRAGRLERLAISAWESGALPVVVLTKSDLASDPSRAVRIAEQAAPGIEVLLVDALHAAGLEGVRAHLGGSRTAVLLGGGALIDTPGLRSIALWDADEGIDRVFPEVEALARRCRFHDCAHGAEPGCAIRAALEAGDLDEARWQRYQRVERERAFEERKEDPAAREAQRKQWVRINREHRKRRNPKHED